MKKIIGFIYYFILPLKFTFRRILLRMMGGTIGSNTNIYELSEKTIAAAPWKISIGNNSHIGYNCTINAFNGVSI